MGYHYQSANQYQFERTLGGIGIVLRYIFRLFIYLPVIFVGYYLSNLVLSPTDNSLNHLLIAIVFSYFVFLLIFFLKGLLISLKERGNNSWIVLFLFCVAFTCLLSPWLLIAPVSTAFFRCHFSGLLVLVVPIA